jgi:hypothetical protein
VARQRRDSAHPLQQIQNHPLAGKQYAGIVANDCDGLAGVHANTIKNLRMAGDLGVCSNSAIQLGENFEHTRNRAQPGDHAILLGQHCRARPLMHVNARVGSGVAGGLVLGQCVFKNAGDAVTVPVHVLIRFCGATKILHCG